MADKTGRTASAVTVSTKVTGNAFWVGRVIEQATAETSKPSAEQTVTETAFDTGIDYGRDTKLRSPSTEDSQARDQGLASIDFVSPAADLRTDLTVLDPGTDSEEDPLQLDNSKPSREELEDSLPVHGSQDEEASLGDMKEAHDRARGAISQSAGTAFAPVRYDDEGVHGGGGKTAEAFKDTELGRVGKAIGEGAIGNAGAALKQATLEQDLTSGSATRHVSKDGKTTATKEADGTKTVEVKNEDGTTTTTVVNPDGSTITTTKDANGKVVHTEKTEPLEVPRDDYLPPEERQKLIEEAGLDKIYRGSHDNDEIQPVRDDTIANAGEETGAMVDLKDILLGGDRLDDNEYFGGGGGIGDAGDRTSQNGGATDWGPDHADPQGSGPEERNQQHEIERDVVSAQQDGQKGEDTAEETEEETVIARRTEVSERLPDTIEQNDAPSKDQPIDPDRLVRVRGEDVAPGATANDSGDVARIIASTDRFDFVQVQSSLLDAELQPVHTDGGRSNDDAFAVAEAVIVHHDLVAQAAFDFDFV